MFIVLASVLLQTTPGLISPPVSVRPPSDSAVQPNLRSLGDTLQIAGHCSKLMAPSDFDKMLIVAQANDADTPYLMGRITEGLRVPKSARWCSGRIKDLN